MSNKREEHIHCVGFGNAFNTSGDKTWCGNDHGLIEPFFIDINHAVMNGANKGRLMVCPECKAVIEAGLNNGYE